MDSPEDCLDDDAIAGCATKPIDLSGQSCASPPQTIPRNPALLIGVRGVVPIVIQIVWALSLPSLQPKLLQAISMEQPDAVAQLPSAAEFIKHMVSFHELRRMSAETRKRLWARMHVSAGGINYLEDAINSINAEFEFEIGPEESKHVHEQGFSARWSRRYVRRDWTWGERLYIVKECKKLGVDTVNLLEDWAALAKDMRRMCAEDPQQLHRKRAPGAGRKGAQNDVRIKLITWYRNEKKSKYRVFFSDVQQQKNIICDEMGIDPALVSEKMM
eukprot:gene5918-5149_t